jgi:transcriptional regulator with XRE-family HTH domain
MPIGPQIRIRDLREAHGITVNQLVERIVATGYTDKLHPDTIRNVELGHKRGSKLLMVAWAKALGLSPLDVWQPAEAQSGAA